MKKEIDCCCDVYVKGHKMFKPFIEKAVNRFVEHMKFYYKLGLVKSVKLNVYFKEKNIKNE